MESTGIPGRIQVSRSTYELLHDKMKFEERVDVEVKGVGVVNTYLLAPEEVSAPLALSGSVTNILQGIDSLKMEHRVMMFESDEGEVSD